MPIHQNHRFELYLVFTEPQSKLEVAGLLRQNFGLEPQIFLADDLNFVRAARLCGEPVLLDADVLNLCCASLGVSWRWLEFGWRAYGEFDGRPEAQPWRKNRYLRLEELRALKTIELGVHYHAPER